MRTHDSREMLRVFAGIGAGGQEFNQIYSYLQIFFPDVSPEPRIKTWETAHFAAVLLMDLRGTSSRRYEMVQKWETACRPPSPSGAFVVIFSEKWL